MPMHVEYRSYVWPQASTIDHEPPHENSHDFYKFDDEIVAFDPKTEQQVITPIMVPMAFADSICLSDSVKFLKSTSASCLVLISQLCSYNKNLIQQLLNLRLFRQPSKKTESREGSNAFGINIQACKHSFSNCTQIMAGDQVELEMLNDEVFDEVRMEFLVNDTSVTAASVSFISNEDLVCDDEDGLKKVIQKFDVTFKSVAGTSTRRIRNVPRGYNNDDLISASRLVLVNETVPDGETILDYLKNGTTPEQDFYMKIPTSRKGFCVLTNETFDFIRFNENSLTVCKLALSRNDQLNISMCDQIKQQIFHHQLSMLRVNFNSTKSYSDIFISKLWSPRAEITSWAKVNLENFPPTTGEVAENDSSCASFASLRYNFFTSRKQSSKTRKYDYNIERVTIESEPASEVKKFDFDSENKTAEITLQVQVQFFLLENVDSSSIIWFGSVFNIFSILAIALVF